MELMAFVLAQARKGMCRFHLAVNLHRLLRLDNFTA